MIKSMYEMKLAPGEGFFSFFPVPTTFLKPLRMLAMEPVLVTLSRLRDFLPVFFFLWFFAMLATDQLSCRCRRIRLTHGSLNT